MQTDFDWQTDEEDGFESRPSEVPAEPTVSKYWSRRLVVGLLLVVTAIYGGLRWRAHQQSEAILADVLVSHQLVQTAVFSQDLEKLNLVLSGRELDWQAAQQKLLLNDDFINRSAFNLNTLSASSHPTITLSPNLQEAVVVYDQPYTLPTGEDLVLQQTAVYRQGAHNWLLSPPQDAFWGANVVTRTHYFALTYPQRDEELVLSLAHDLGELTFTILCGGATDCFIPPFQFQLPLRFGTQPQTLLAMNDTANWLQTNDPLILPTPTLVGLPQDEAGYQALYRAYGARLTTAVMPYAFGYECCAHGLMASAFLTKEASELNLQPWPLSPVDYQKILNFTYLPENPNDLLNIGLDAPERQMEAFALVDFLIASNNHPVRWWLAGILPAGELDISWPPSVRRKDFGARWLTYIYEQASYGLSSLAPESGLALEAVCREAEGRVYYRYDLETAVWTKIANVPPLGNDTQLWPLPGSDGYLAFQEIRTRFDIESRLTLHDKGREAVVMQVIEPMFRPVPYYRFTGQTDPTGRYLLLFEPGLSRYQIRYFLFDFLNCLQDVCPPLILFGQPVWSPSGAQMIVAERPSPDENMSLEAQLQQVRLLRGTGDGENLTAVARGYNPHWLDDKHYLYFRSNEADLPEVVQAAVSDDVAQVWLETDDLLSVMPFAERPSTLTITDLAIYSPQQAAIQATGNTGENHIRYLFLWQPPAAPRLVYQTHLLVEMAFAPNGRWLTVTDASGIVTLIDTQTDEQQLFDSPTVTPSWTSDGQWLLTGRENYLLLTAPSRGYQQLVFNRSDSCSQIMWAR